MAIISSPSDMFIFFGILATLVALSAGILKSAVLALFGGLLFVYLGVYGFMNDIGLQSLNFAVSITAALFGVYLIFSSAISIMEGEW